MSHSSFFCFFFFFNDTATTEIYTTANTLSLHDALPISPNRRHSAPTARAQWSRNAASTRSEEHTSELQSLAVISYAVFCLKNKKTQLCLSLLFVRLYPISSSHRLGDL